VESCVLDALMLLGVRCADSSLMHATIEAWSSFFCASSTANLTAMVNCFDAIPTLNHRVRSVIAIPTTLLAFRTLMLSQKLVILSNGDILSPLYIPIHQTATSQPCALDPKLNVLPPSNVTIALPSI